MSYENNPRKKVEAEPTLIAPSYSNKDVKALIWEKRIQGKNGPFNVYEVALKREVILADGRCFFVDKVQDKDLTYAMEALLKAQQMISDRKKHNYNTKRLYNEVEEVLESGPVQTSLESSEDDIPW